MDSSTVTSRPSRSTRSETGEVAKSPLTTTPAKIDETLSRSPGPADGSGIVSGYGACVGGGDGAAVVVEGAAVVVEGAAVVVEGAAVVAGGAVEGANDVTGLAELGSIVGVPGLGDTGFGEGGELGNTVEV